MSDKTLGVVALGLSAASQAFITHDGAVFYSIVFFAIGVYEFAIGELRQRQSTPPANQRHEA